MILFERGQEPSNATEKGQEPVHAVDLPRIASDSELSVQSDFGRESKSLQNTADSKLKSAVVPEKTQASSGFIGDMALLIGIAAMPPVMYLVFLLFN